MASLSAPRLTIRLIAVFLLFFIFTLPARAQNLLPQDDPNSTIDSDSDGLTDYQEIHVYHTDPHNSDTDDDGYKDGEEVSRGYSPRDGNGVKLSQADSDNDGLTDDLEIKFGTDLLNSDTDGDGHPDGAQVYAGFNPLKTDDRSLPRRAEVDVAKQQIYYFLNNIQIGAIPVSTGLAKTPTPPGNYKIMAKKPTVNYFGVGYSFPNTKWNLLFKQGQLGYYLHGTFWHNQFGIQPMSHGCVNIAYNNAEKLYNFLDVGDQVKVYGKWTGKWKTPVKVKK